MLSNGFRAVKNGYMSAKIPRKQKHRLTSQNVTFHSICTPEGMSGWTAAIPQLQSTMLPDLVIAPEPGLNETALAAVPETVYTAGKDTALTT